MSVTKVGDLGKPFSEIREMASSLCDLVSKAVEKSESLYDTEKAVLRQVLQIGKKAMDAVIALQGDGDLGESVTTAVGMILKRSETPHDRPLRTIFGEHSFLQYVYSRGKNRKIELRPIDARLSLSPRVSSYLLEEFSQLFCIESAFGQSAKHFATVFDQELSVDTLEAISRSMGTDAEAYLDNLPVPPAKKEGEILVGTVDGKGVPLIREDGPKVKAFETRKLRPGNRRMATVAGVYSVDAHVRTPQEIVAALFRDELLDEKSARPKPKFKHLSAHFPETYGEGEETVVSTGAIEACCWISEEIELRRKKLQPLLMLIDGDHRLWDTSFEHLPEDTIEILDILHVSSYIWEAADVFCDSPAERESFTRVRLLAILQGKVKSVIRGLRHMATARRLRGEARKKILTTAKYFEAHAERMHYDEYLAAGYPIATGVIEGACRHMVKDRMERSGMRWTLEGAKAMLNVRAVHESQSWDDFHTQRRKDECESSHPHRQLMRSYQPLNLAC